MEKKADPLDLYRFNLSKKLLKNFKNNGNLFRGKSVLNIGSGRGRETYLILFESPMRLILLDINFDHLVFSRRKLDSLQNNFFLCADGIHLPFKDKAIDIIMVTETLHHLIDPYKALGEMARVSRKAIILDEPRRGRLRNMLNYLFIKTDIKKPYEFEGDRKLSFRFDMSLLKKIAENFDLDFICYPYFIYYFEFYKNTNLRFIKYIYKFICEIINVFFHSLGNRAIIIFSHRF